MSQPSVGLPDVSPSDATRLLDRLVLRQLYSYQPVDPDVGDEGNPPTPIVGPRPDLASAGPKLTDGGRTATITLRSARWDLSSNARRVTANDAVRALKRLCLPTIESPVRGYLAETVVGYAAACRSLRTHPPRTLSRLDEVSIPGLTTAGDTTLVIKLIRPADDLTAMLALPETSPLPVEDFDGTQVIADSQGFVGDGPYHFVEPQGSETYALSRNPNWSPADDPLRNAYVDHVSVHGGYSPAKVLQLVESGGADLSLDVPASAALAAEKASGEQVPAVVRSPDQAALVLALGTTGPARLRLSVPAVRRVLVACVNDATRARVVAAVGAGLSSASDDLLAGLSTLPAGSPSPTPTVTPSASAAESPVTPSSPGTARSSSGGASAAPTPSTSPPVRRASCAPTAALAGVSLSMLVVDSPALRAAAGVLVTALAKAGVKVVPRVVATQQYVTAAAAGGWDLALALRPLPYPAPRSLLAPMLDPSWIGEGGVAMARSPMWVTRMFAAAGEQESAAMQQAWQALRNTLTDAAVIAPLATIDGVYPRGPNLAHAPTVATFSNADPTNVSLGSTRPGEPARSPTAKP